MTFGDVVERKDGAKVASASGIEMEVEATGQAGEETESGCP